MSFTPAQVALLDDNAEFVEVRRLFRITFPAHDYRLTEGNVALTTTDGATWEPAHDLVSAAPIEAGGPLEAVATEYRLSPLTPELATAALHDKAAWYGVPVQQLMQLLVEGVPVGPPVSLHRGWLSDVVRDQDHATDVLTLKVEGVFAKRNYTPLGEYTDRDQQRRSPGDLGCAIAPSLKGKIIKGWLRA